MADWVGSAPLFVGPRWLPRGAENRTGLPAAVPDPKSARSDGAAAPDEEDEPFCEDSVRNRQKELQDAIVAAENAEAILSTSRELDGAIVISTALHRLGKVASTTSAEVFRDPRFLLLMEKFRSRLPFFGSRQISNSLHGLGSMMCRDHGMWVDMVSIQTQRRIRDFEPQHVSNTLWACARMQLKESLMMQALLGRAIEDLPRSCPLDVSIVTWALATLKWKDADWLRAVVRARLDFADFSPQNMSNFVWGLATLGFRNDNLVLAVGREAARRLQDFIPQELSNFCWALATLDLCDNLMLRAVAEEVERRGDELHTWDPQSLSNMMWAFATLAVKDDPLFQRLLDASVARIADHDPQNLANSSWAAAMVCFRSSRFLDAVAQSTVQHVSECQTLHLAQLAFAFVRLCYEGERFELVRAVLDETLRRLDDFAPQSLFDVYDMLRQFAAITAAPNHPIQRCLSSHYEGLVERLEAFSRQCARGRPTAAQVGAYRRSIEQLDIVTLGVHHTHGFLRHFGLLCPEQDPFVQDARRQIREWRDAEARKDPVSRSIFHRAQCAWQLGVCGAADAALADGIFESGEPSGGGPESHGLVVCRLRHPREGDAEIRALCAVLSTSAMRSGKAPSGLTLNLHLSDVPCVSCLGATLQFGFRFPGVLRVSFDRGRQIREDSVPVPRPPPPPSKKGNPLPYAPIPEFNPRRAEAGTQASEGLPQTQRCLMRREGPDCRETTSFYLGGSRGPRRADGAASGGQEAVPHKMLSNLKGSSQQTYYFSARPDFYGANDYEGCDEK